MSLPQISPVKKHALAWNTRVDSLATHVFSNMHFEHQHIYHVYNRGNNSTKIFFQEANYIYLLRKIKQEWLSYCDLLSYCLAPNHFHFMLKPHEDGCRPLVIKEKPTHLQVLSKTIGKTLSSYSQAINVQNRTTGTLFQKKTKAKCLTDDRFFLDGLKSSDYLENCFRYIHNIPLAGLLVDNPGEWRWSSWHEYFGTEKQGICNQVLAGQLLGMEILETLGAGRIHLNNQAIFGIW